jgi:hypothetical protein
MVAACAGGPPVLQAVEAARSLDISRIANEPQYCRQALRAKRNLCAD